MSELRCDPTTGRWVIIAADRSKRPKKGASGCPFCPGNEDKTPPEIQVYPPSRAPANGPGWQVRVVPNAFGALAIFKDAEIKVESVGLYDSMPGYGAHEVIIESPNHDVFFEDQPAEQMKAILEMFKARMVDLYRDPKIKQVLIFKNSGDVAGASLGHPHSQLMGTAVVPMRQKDELRTAMGYYKERRSCIWCDILFQELYQGLQIFDDAGNIIKEDPPKIRLVFKNESFVALCPWAPRFPYEIHILPQRHSHFYGNIGKQNSLEIDDLASAFKAVIKKLNGVLKNVCPDRVPYNFMLHTSPNINNARKFETIVEDFHWHFEIYPVLSKVAAFERGSDYYINITSPEDAAKNLREFTVEEKETNCK